MEFAEVVRRRRMVRNYTDDPVDPAVVDRALANAVRAPSAGFSQGWGFLVLDTPDDVRRYWTATADDLDDPDEWLSGMMRAPVVIVPCSSKAAYLGRYAEPDKGWTDRDEARWPVPFWHMDAAMACAADPADGGRRGTRRVLLRHPSREGPGGPGRVRDPRRLRPGRHDHDRPSRAHAGGEGLSQPSAPQGARRGRAPREMERARLTWAPVHRIPRSTRHHGAGARVSNPRSAGVQATASSRG